MARELGQPVPSLSEEPERTNVYRITKGIHIHFAHHVRGHRGACISLHGHTWMFEVTLGARTLDSEGFVRDFGVLRREVLQPAHLLLDHSLAIGPDTWAETAPNLASLGNLLVDSRRETIGCRGERQVGYEGDLGGARNEFPGDIKITVFPFSPTSERFAEWLFAVAQDTLEDDRVKVLKTRIYEALQPVPTFAEWAPE